AAVCSPGTVDITAAAVTAGSTSGLTYTYWTDAGATSSLASPTAVSTSGTYYIKGTTGVGCSMIEPVTVSIDLLKTTASATSPTLCNGSSTTITAAPSNGIAPYNYSWTPFSSLSSSIVSNPVATPTSTQVYTVTVTDANNCSATANVTVTVEQITASIATTAATCTGGSI